MSTLSQWTAADGTTIALDGTAGVSVRRGVAGLDCLPSVRTLDQRVNSSGAVMVSSRQPERPIMVPLLFDPAVISMATIVRAFQGPGTLTASSGRSLREVIYVDGLDAPRTIDNGGIEGQTFRKVDIGLVALDPWWYGPEEWTFQTFGTPTAWNAAVAWNASIPWDGGSSTLITNSGDTATPVIIVVQGPTTTAAMSVGGVGGWTMAVAVLAAEYLSVSGEAGRRGPHRGPHGYFTGTDSAINWALLDEGSQLFELPRGSSSLVTGATGTSGGTAWWAFWSPRYLTP